jgi:hypothetical protein
MEIFHEASAVYEVRVGLGACEEKMVRSLKQSTP